MTKGNSLKEAKVEANSFSARIVFCRAGSSPQPLSIELVYDGQKAIYRVDLEFPDEISEKELYWKKYDDVGTCAVYQRDVEGKYYDGEESRINTVLEQRLERIIRENFTQNGTKTK